MKSAILCTISLQIYFCRALNAMLKDMSMTEGHHDLHVAEGRLKMLLVWLNRFSIPY